LTTLPALIAHWARVVDYVDREAMTADEFRADVDVRHQIAVRMRKQSFTPETREMLADLDGQFRAATLASEECIHGADVAAREGWTAVREWYFWRVSAKGATATISS
jgi:hypothetical protein